MEHLDHQVAESAMWDIVMESKIQGLESFTIAKAFLKKIDHDIVGVEDGRHQVVRK
jgi:hypothetical protein